jgi:pantetheine-phosphate adenylyltransferase
MGENCKKELKKRSIMKKAIYSLSADPITFGHIDIITRASKIFDEVIVAIGKNPAKKYLFDLNDRIEMATEAVAFLSNVTVTSFEGMLSDYAYSQSIQSIVRGVRNIEDFNYELMLHQVTQSQNLGLDTVFLPSSQAFSHISSGVVKAIQLEQGLIDEYVPLNVKAALEKKISNQEIIGVTGPIGSGKSYYCKKQVAKNKEAHHVDLDALAHDVLERLTEPIYIEYRKSLIKVFGDEIAHENGFINRKELGYIVFQSPEKMAQLNQLTKTPLLTYLRKVLHGLTGKIFIEGALLIETGWTFICNNEVVILNVDPKIQHQRLLDRGYSNEQINNRIKSQFTFEEKHQKMNEIIESTGYGSIYLE